MAEAADRQHVGETSQPYTPRQLLGKLKTFEDLADVVFYVPFVYNLIRDRQRTAYTTDVFSHSLMQVLGDHPLIVTELAGKIFEAQPPIILTPDQKTFERAVYITPKNAWNVLAEELKIVTAIDRTTHRFSIFRLYEEEIPCPLGHHTDKMIKVWYCNLYGNKETYYFLKGIEENGTPSMQLYYSPPIKEFVELGDRLLGMVHKTSSIEKAFEIFSEEPINATAHLFARQKHPKLQETLAPKTLEESQLTAAQRADCYEMIKMYYQVYGEVP